MIEKGTKMLYIHHSDRGFRMMRYFLYISVFVVIVCFSAIAVPVSEIAKLNGVQCSPLTASDGWRKEIRELLSTPAIAGKPYLTRVSEALDSVNQAQVDSKTLYSASSTIRMSICDFPIKYQPVLRQIVVNLTLRAAMEGEKDAIYDMMDTYPSPQDLMYVSIVEGNKELTTDDFAEIRKNLEETDVDEMHDTEQLKKIVEKALARAKSAPNSPGSSPLKREPLKQRNSF